jgi:hypothetical protein
MDVQPLIGQLPGPVRNPLRPRANVPFVYTTL